MADIHIRELGNMIRIYDLTIKNGYGLDQDWLHGHF
jgi:hypothetical protein